MTRAAEMKTINCTACGAGLDVLGGGRVVAHICSYCGSELDAQHDYAVLKKKTNALNRPDTPFQIGMSGEIFGVTFTIIGIMETVETYMHLTWRWVDHMVFSPTHGYGYLTVEDGHLTFTRRQRELPNPPAITETMVATYERPPIARLKGERYTYYDSSSTKIVYAEGEFNWTPRQGEQRRVITAMSDDAMLSFSSTQTESEVERTLYLPPETWASWGLEAPQRLGTHPLQPFHALRHAGFLKVVAGGFAGICLVLTVLFATNPGTQVLARTPFDLSQLPTELSFEITKPGKLAELEIWGDVNNSWAAFEIALTDPEDQPVFIAGQEIGYYFGRDSDGSWVEGSKYSTLRWRPETAGTYTLEVELDETGLWSRNSGAALTKITVAAREGQSSGLWTGLAALLFGLFAGIPMARSYWHQKKRWSGSDWEDDDDD